MVSRNCLLLFLLLLLGGGGLFVVAGEYNVAENPSLSFHHGDEEITSFFANVTEADAFRYDLRDDTGASMASLDILQLKTPSNHHHRHDKYVGLYHSFVDDQFEVRVATSNDLLSWTYIRTLLPNADMPHVARVQQHSDWVLVAHEQWMHPESVWPCRLAFRLYNRDTDLLEEGAMPLHVFVAPLTVGNHSRLEGTPNIYRAWTTTIVEKQHGSNQTTLAVVSADVGFHYNNVHGVDQVAHGRLDSFGTGTTARGDDVVTDWRTAPATNYNRLFHNAGASGNIGQRSAGWFLGRHVVLQEANLGPAPPPTVWKNWRVWLYFFAPNEGGTVPTGATGSRVLRLDIQTHGGSTAFGNDSWRIVSCPNSESDQCLVVTYFIFAEGAASEEAGVCIFYRRLGLFDSVSSVRRLMD